MIKEILVATIATAATLIGAGIVSGNQGDVPTPAVGVELAYDTSAAWHGWLELMDETGQTNDKTSAGRLARVWPDCNTPPLCKETHKNRCHVWVTCYGRWSGKMIGSFVTRAPDAPSDCKDPDNKARSGEWLWNSLGRCPESHVKWDPDLRPFPNRATQVTATGVETIRGILAHNDPCHPEPGDDPMILGECKLK